MISRIMMYIKTHIRCLEIQLKHFSDDYFKGPNADEEILYTSFYFKILLLNTFLR